MNLKGKIIEIKKGDIKFTFEVKGVSMRHLVLRWKCEGKGISNGINKKNEDGFYANACIDHKRKAILCRDLFGKSVYKLNGKLSAGVQPYEQDFEMLCKLEDEIKESKKVLELELVNKIVSGEMKALCCLSDRYFDGYESKEKALEWDFSKYKDGMKFYDTDESEILSAAVNELGLKTYSIQILEGFIERRMKDVWVEDSEITLLDTLRATIDKKSIKEKEIAAIKQKVIDTGVKQELSRWVEDCNDPYEECSTDICIEYAMPDGTVKVERSHT
jgi:hypothetical protein